MYNNSGINRVFLLGTISKEPRKHKSNGEELLCFTLVTHEIYDRSGAPIDHYETHNIKVQTSVPGFELVKNQVVHIEGKIHTEAFTDTEGIRRYKTDIIASRIVRVTPAEPEAAEQATRQRLGIDQ